MTTTPPGPIDPRRAQAPTDPSDSDWATATGTLTIRRPEPAYLDSAPADTSFFEDRDDDTRSLATL